MSKSKISIHFPLKNTEISASAINFLGSSPLFGWLFLGLLPCLLSCSATRNITLNDHTIMTINRKLIPNPTDPYTIELDSQPGAGIALFKNLDFAYGMLEFELRGENNPGASFIGLAFNIQDDSTYEAIYFRPFNFKSPEKSQRGHSLQYIYHPQYTWNRLRQNHPGKYEAEYLNSPDPDEWFRIRLIIDPEKIIVQDRKSKQTLLEIARLASTNSKKLGFWTGNNSRGSFRNLSLIKTQMTVAK